jgi:hypothetical protein
MTETRKFQCYDCQHIWTVPHGTGRPAECPVCHKRNICRGETDRGPGTIGAQGANCRCRRGQMQN